jgi:hypothetical protein
VNVHLKPGPELEKTEREVAEDRRFADLVVEEVAAVSEAICTARPARRPLRRRAKGGSRRTSRRSPPPR